MPSTGLPLPGGSVKCSTRQFAGWGTQGLEVRLPLLRDSFHHHVRLNPRKPQFSHDFFRARCSPRKPQFSHEFFRASRSPDEEPHCDRNPSVCDGVLTRSSHTNSFGLVADQVLAPAVLPQFSHDFSSGPSLANEEPGCDRNPSVCDGASTRSSPRSSPPQFSHDFSSGPSLAK